MTTAAERFGIDYVHPLINYRERDGEPAVNFEEAIERARGKAAAMVTLSSGRLKVLDEVRDDEKSAFTINFAFVQGGKPTGGFIEVNLIPPSRSGLAVVIRGGLEELSNTY